MGAPDDERGAGLSDRIEDGVLAAAIGAARQLPYDRRVPFMGALTSHLVAPVAGYRKRIRDNLALVCPELPPAEVARLCRAVPDNLGRSLIEIFSPQDLLRRAEHTPLTGPGFEVIEAARAAGRPAIIVTGHIGNYEIARAALQARGYSVGALYKPMRNRYFNARYLRAMSHIDTPLFARSRDGLARMIRFLRGGGLLCIVVDQRIARGAPLRFFGHEARTALSAAELALRFGAPLVPGYAIRRPDGLNFDVSFEAPVARDTPEAMTQALNDSLEVQVRAHMDQWLWTHRRWKLPRRQSAGRAEPRIRP